MVPASGTQRWRADLATRCGRDDKAVGEELQPRASLGQRLGDAQRGMESVLSWVRRAGESKLERKWRGCEPCVRLFAAVGKCATAETWNFGLRATRSREPRQARKGATVPGKPSVPRGLRSSSS